MSTDQRGTLRSKFKESNRSNNFGNTIERILIQGFRCHSNTLLNINSPVTALCGLNGVGKSTILHLVAAAYQNPENRKTYSIKDFIEKQKFDPAPFTEDASVEFVFHQPAAQNRKKIKQLTISRQKDRWNGYKRRLKKPVCFIGIGSYLPKIEKADFIYRYPHEVTLLAEAPVKDNAKSWICKILSRGYESVVAQEYSLRKRKGKINRVEQFGITYSESHMGFGEARSHYLVRTLEELPAKSLVLIEEPEISLHPSAQYYFGCYLVDVCIRKGHQIFLTTHSESLLNALPSESRVFLQKAEDGVRTIEGLTASQAHSLMTDGKNKALKVLVEDEGEKSLAKIILEEIIRKEDQTFLSCLEIHPVGDCESVKNIVGALENSQMSIAGVLDADQDPRFSQEKDSNEKSKKQDDKKKIKNLFFLPGNNTVKTDCAPEKEIFSCSKVKDYLQEQHDFNLGDFQTRLVGVNHHDWFEKLAEQLSVREIAIMTELAKIYVSTLPETFRASLVDQLKAACS